MGVTLISMCLLTVFVMCTISNPRRAVDMTPAWEKRILAASIALQRRSNGKIMKNTSRSHSDAMLHGLRARVPERDQRPQNGHFLHQRNSLSIDVHDIWGLSLHGRCPTAPLGLERQTISLKIASEFLHRGPCLYMRRPEDIHIIRDEHRCTCFALQLLQHLGDIRARETRKARNECPSCSRSTVR